jgi:hypothetical protein
MNGWYNFNKIWPVENKLFLMNKHLTGEINEGRFTWNRTLYYYNNIHKRWRKGNDLKNFSPTGVYSWSKLPQIKIDI